MKRNHRGNICTHSRAFVGAEPHGQLITARANGVLAMAQTATEPTIVEATTTMLLAMHTNQPGIDIIQQGQPELGQQRLWSDEQQAAGESGESGELGERPDTATLTKGFSIPTYLPPFPDFIAADLPQTTQTTTMRQTAADELLAGGGSNGSNAAASFQPQSNEHQAQPQQPHMRLHAYDSEQKALQLRREKELARERELLPRRQLSLPALNVTVQAAQHAYLPCQLHQHSNKPLSWVRLRDGHIIAVDHTTFINDARFTALLQPTSNGSSSSSSSSNNNGNATANISNGNGHGNGNGTALPVTSTSSATGTGSSWTLQIKYVTLEDAGWYECQLATEPKMSAKVQLLVITPQTELIGDQQRFVKAGSKVELHCIVRGTLEAPKYIFWYRGDKQITTAENEAQAAATANQDWFTQIDRNIFGSTEHNRNTIGTLIIPLVRKAHSGNYTCEPENSAAVSMQLHVLSGEYSASAIMSTAAGLHRCSFTGLQQWLIFLLVALTKT